MASMSSAVISSTTDPTSILNTQLASALSTLGDAQFWEETISPSTIRSELSASDPSNPNSTPTLLKGMKWLLASISKGRDVSDFYPHVVKLVGATSLEVRKMVYMYLVQYADHDATTRELSLLSINSFQRGLADAEQLIRALALRVLSSIRIADILQIQILAVQKCAKDRSPYVRKCAANALSKLAPRCSNDEMQKDMLLDIMVELLNTDTSTMVLSSALTAFCEMCPTRLELLHGCFRKICHLLTDMDEWGQVVILDVLSRYTRKFFKEPRGWKNGTAEKIDRERRVRRTVTGLAQQGSLGIITSSSTTTVSQDVITTLDVVSSASAGPKVVTRRVVQKGFYSDEEDESVEEEVQVVETPLNNTRNILGLPGVAQNVNKDAEEDMDLDEDHRLLLQSAMPLLKSRNAGVVLQVCSLLYYCGVSSVKTRSAIGKALVRIHRGRREIQYVVLTSIRTLVKECPSAFAPFLNDFFVKALDPPHTRIIKVDILVSLALEPAAIEAVLKELRTYIRSADKKFVAAAIRAVGRVAELARIVYDRHGQKSGSALQERQTANRIALDCLYGLAVVTQAGDSKLVIGEAVCVMQSILTMLLSDAGNEPGSLQTVEDPNQVQNFALRRILLLLVNTLVNRSKESTKDNGEEDEDDDDEKEPTDLEKVSLELPEHAVASALWIVGDWLTCSYSTLGKLDENAKSKMRSEIVRLVDRTFPEMSLAEKCQAIHFCTKVLLLSGGNGTPSALCEHVLSMGRIDVHPDVKDQARMESAIIQASIGLKHDLDNMESQPSMGMKLTVDTAKRLLLTKKPAPSFLPVEDDSMADKRSFRFGTLSSLVGHQARGAYLPLPPWSEKNSPKALRDPIEAVKQQVSGVPASSTLTGAAPGFYGPGESSSSDSDDESSSSDSSSTDSASGDQNDADSESESDSGSDDDSSSGDDNNNNNNINNMFGSNGNAMGMNVKMNMATTANNNMMGMNLMQPMGQPMGGAPGQSNHMTSTDGGSSSSDDSSSSSSSSSSYQGDVSSTNLRLPQEGNLLSMGGAGFGPGSAAALGGTSSSAMDDLRGLVMAPIAIDESTASDPDIERDSSAWTQLVRPEVGGGLSVRARILRGPTKAREAQLKGLNPKLPHVVCVQVQFGNKKTDSNSLRRIKIFPKSSSSGAFAVKKALCPPDIAELKSGQVANATLCLEFASASDREGDMVGRFDIKTSTGGGIPIEIKPSLGDLLTPQKAPSVADFDASMNRMQGFQRVTSKFQSSKLDAVPQILLKSAALTPVGKAGWQGNKLRLIGGLPASNDLVFARVECDPNSGAGMITVCCDHAVAVNSIMNILKHAVS